MLHMYMSAKKDARSSSLQLCDQELWAKIHFSFPVVLVLWCFITTREETKNTNTYYIMSLILLAIPIILLTTRHEIRH